MDEIRRDARLAGRSWAVAGSIALAAGLLAWTVNWVHNQGWWFGWVCGGLFVIVGAYLIRRAGPFTREIERLVREDVPCEMQATLVVQFGDPDEDTYAELRFPEDREAPRPPIRVAIDHEAWMEAVKNPISAKVWGARRSTGPVVIETAHGRLFPSGPGAVRRC